MMKTRTALLVGAALLSTPAFAQDAQPAPQTVAPPPILVTPAPAPAPAAPLMQMAPQSPIVQPAPPPGPRAEDVAAAAATEARAQRSTRSAPARQVRAEAPAPRAAVSASAAPAPATQSAAAAPATDTTTAVTTGSVGTPPAEAASAAPTVSDTTNQETSRAPRTAWPLMVGGILLVLAGAAALLLLRRRRTEPEYVEDRVYDDSPVYEAPVVPEPVYAREPAAAAAPIVPAFVPDQVIEEAPLEAHSEAELAEPDREELAGVADAAAPVANRPWLEFGLRPVRAGTNDEEALVDVELTVGNAGDQAARDVRISTFMLADADDGEMERLLTGHRGDTAVPPVTIAPGDGTRIDAHLAVPKGELGHTFNPVVVAEARYTLPDGREGRTSAAFKIGRSAPDLAGVGAIGASRPHVVEDVEAELLGVPEHT